MSHQNVAVAQYLGHSTQVLDILYLVAVTIFVDSNILIDMEICGGIPGMYFPIHWLVNLICQCVNTSKA